MFTIYEKEGLVKRICGEFTPAEWLVVLSALNWYIRYGNTYEENKKLAKKIVDTEQKFVEENTQ